MTKDTLPPPPGSKTAQDMGCSCPVMDNCRGAGYFGDGTKHGWVINQGCPLHDKTK